MTVDKIIPCVCCEHPPSVADSSEYGMPILIPYNSSAKEHLQFWNVKCPKCGRGGCVDEKSAYLALKKWNQIMRRCYAIENKEIVFYEDWKNTCERLGYEYIDYGEKEGDLP